MQDIFTAIFWNTWFEMQDGKRSGLLRGNMDNVVYSTDGSLKAANFEVLDRGPSDHTPLLAQFRIG